MEPFSLVWFIIGAAAGAVLVMALYRAGRK